MTGVVVVGVSNSGTPAGQRERLHLDPERAAAMSRSLAGQDSEVVVLATCNRTELYLTGDAAERRARLALAELSRSVADPAGIYVRSDESAAHHLFRVAAGLESIVLGDTHVAAQVRQAHQAARQVGATGPLLDRLFETASAASKRIRSRTSVSSGSTSIPAAAIAAAARAVGRLSDRRVLIVGAGSVAEVVAREAWSRGCRDIVVANRTPESAVRLAEQVGGRPESLEHLRGEVAAADIVFTATSGRGFVLTREHLAPHPPLAIFDLAQPRDVDPAFRMTSRLFDLDDLGRAVAANGARRRADVERADAIAREEASRYEAWRRIRSAAPAITALRDDAEETRRSVLARHGHDLARLGSTERELVDALTRQLVNKLLHGPTLELRRQAREGIAPVVAHSAGAERSLVRIQSPRLHNPR